MAKKDPIENLLELDGLRYVIDEYLGLWVKFDAKKVAITLHRPHGVKYSFSLHDKHNQRLMGFDNAHGIEANNKVYDHWHRYAKDEGRYYCYLSSSHLVQDFWQEVNKIHKKLWEINHEKN